MLLLALAAPVGAPPVRAQEISAEQKAVAAKTFRQAEADFRRHEYKKAAEGFEEANSIAPHPAALFNAARAWEKAGELTRAANLCARYLADAPEDDSRRTKANALIGELTPKLGRIEVIDKGAKNVQIDGQPRELEVTYVDAGDHTVSGVFGDRVVRRKISVVAGSLARVVLEKPKPKPEPTAPAAQAPEQDLAPPAEPSKKPLKPTWVYVGAGVTAVLAGATVWSGLDTQSARTDYDANPTPEGLDDGRAKQRRTNLLLGASVVAGVGTGALALFFTDWSSEPKPEPEADLAIGVGPDGVAIGGRF